MSLSALLSTKPRYLEQKNDRFKKHRDIGMTIDPKDLLEQLDRHLACANQAWLFGAGISRQAGVPLMFALTIRIRAIGTGTAHQAVLDSIFNELPKDAHIEHFLSHLSDYATLAERSKADEITIGATKLKVSALADAYKAVVEWIGDTIRWGYRAATSTAGETIGKANAPIVTVDGHKSFVEALFKTSQAGLQDRRGPINLYTTNYDTLLEDALALSSVSYWDGFSGGGIAFRSHHFGDELPTGFRAHVLKLHGSIDWYGGDDGKVWRRLRAEDGLPPQSWARAYLHPQATKYVANSKETLLPLNLISLGEHWQLNSTMFYLSVAIASVTIT